MPGTGGGGVAPSPGPGEGFSAWWALSGLVVTTFAFLGVNMFLSGLHSYGE